MNHCLKICKLKRQCHENYWFRFISGINFPQGPEIKIRVISNFLENLPRYSKVKVNHRFQLYQVCTLSWEYLHEFSKKFETTQMGILRGLGETDSWKNIKSIISWHCPFKVRGVVFRIKNWQGKLEFKTLHGHIHNLDRFIQLFGSAFTVISLRKVAGKLNLLNDLIPSRSNVFSNCTSYYAKLYFTRWHVK